MPLILIIDDDDGMRKLIKLILTNNGYEVIEAADGRKGFELLETRRPELLITDLMLPEIEGLEIIREVRRRWPSLKVVAISGGGRVFAADYLPIAYKLGAKFTLNKPFDNEELLRIVAGALRGEDQASGGPESRP